MTYPNPNTYRPDDGLDPRIQRPQIFDPALWHFSHRAFRLGDPIFQDPDLAERWFEARQQVIEYLLLSVRGSCWNEHLVLRGSMLLKAWLGDTAREPNDIDWVFRSEHVKREDRLAKQLFNELIKLLRKYPRFNNIKIDGANIATDEIWTYERADGRRMLIPWQAEGLPEGTLQVDVVFGERLFDEPVLTPIPTSWNESIPIWSASKALSLAWKIRWLETDGYPQGKDLYDAALLAEQTQLPFDLLCKVLFSSDDWLRSIKYDFPDFYSSPNVVWKSGYPWRTQTEFVEWDNFILEYPWVEGDAQSWIDRLSQALAPTFANLDC
jgi:Nucleotidyl transferase AbiEii toxin, Type IV TA system